ncbi:hypothetical protein SCG7086_CI_00010 [Chlamydiales bacterium SCGC AG-110-P3]|nr:hypothetical protein SCG7086_CI_00010 [Chlamydiales bacterium SCGC AG-110-P3]
MGLDRHSNLLYMRRLIYQLYQDLTTLLAVESIGSFVLKDGQKYERGRRGSFQGNTSRGREHSKMTLLCEGRGIVFGVRKLAFAFSLAGLPASLVGI